MRHLLVDRTNSHEAEVMCLLAKCLVHRPVRQLEDRSSSIGPPSHNGRPLLSFGFKIADFRCALAAYMRIFQVSYFVPCSLFGEIMRK